MKTGPLPQFGICQIGICQLFVLFFVLGVSPGLAAETSKKNAEKALFTWDLLWTGSWYKSIKRIENGFPPPEDLFPGGTLFNRGDLTLALPRQDIAFRFMATDKRLLPLEEDDAKAGFNPGLGIYHRGSGSRLLRGVQSEYGLPARINHVWLRSVPFMESRSPSARDLKTEPSAQDSGETYLYLALPPALLPGFGAFGSAALDGELNPALGGGIDLGWRETELRLEGFYTRKELAPRKAQTWFSLLPPLPERDFRIYALAMVFSSPLAAAATDWALAETFAWGRGIYGNFALRLGNKPWRFSLAGDGAGSRFADRNGSTAGAGFRAAAKTERFWPRSGLLRFQGVFRAPAPGEVFERGSFSAYFRPSAPSAAALRRGASPIRFSRASLSLNRDARTPGKTADTLDALAGFRFGLLSVVFSGALHSLSRLDGEDRIPSLFRPQVFETFESLKVSGELGWTPPSGSSVILDFKTKLSYTSRAEKEPLWEISLNSSVKSAKLGRLGLKIAATDFPEKWNYTLSWRLGIGSNTF